MKISIKTLGCKVNQAESASIEGVLRDNGHEIVPSLWDNPDACIINTCTVTAKTDYQSRQMIRRAVKSGANVIATGCYAQLRPDELSKIKGLDFIIGNSQKNRICEYLEKISLKNSTPAEDSPSEILVDSPESPLILGSYFSNRARAFLKIQDGCNFSCSYCIVPKARGKSRSLSPSEIISAVDDFRALGYREIVLTGIHIGNYGFDLKPENSLLEIVNKIAKTVPDIRVRLTSIEPQEFRKEFLSLINKGAVCSHLHIPLQNGSDRILRAMNRGYSTTFYKNLIKDIVSSCPDISIGTDIIVGFPGEEEKDFENTVKMLEELPFSYLHVFPYSKRPGTKSVTLKGQVTNAVKKKRMKILLEITKKKKNAYITAQLGKKLDVIVEGKDITTCFYRAISDNYIKTLVRADKLVSGQKLQVETVSFDKGELISVPL